MRNSDGHGVGVPVTGAAALSGGCGDDASGREVHCLRLVRRDFGVLPGDAPEVDAAAAVLGLVALLHPLAAPLGQCDIADSQMELRLHLALDPLAAPWLRDAVARLCAADLAGRIWLDWAAADAGVAGAGETARSVDGRVSVPAE